MSPLPPPVSRLVQDWDPQTRFPQKCSKHRLLCSNGNIPLIKAVGLYGSLIMMINQVPPPHTHTHTHTNTSRSRNFLYQAWQKSPTPTSLVSDFNKIQQPDSAVFSLAKTNPPPPSYNCILLYDNILKPLKISGCINNLIEAQWRPFAV